MGAKRMSRGLPSLAAMVAFIATTMASFANDAIVIRPAEDARAASRALSHQAAVVVPPVAVSTPYTIPITVLSGSTYAMRQFEETVWNGLNAQLAKYGCGTSIQRSLERAELEMIVDYLEGSEHLRGRKELDPAFVLAMFKSVPNSCAFGHEAVGNFILSIEIGSTQPAMVSMNASHGGGIESRPVHLGVQGADLSPRPSGTTGGVQIVPLDLRGIYY